MIRKINISPFHAPLSSDDEAIAERMYAPTAMDSREMATMESERVLTSLLEKCVETNKGFEAAASPHAECGRGRGTEGPDYCDCVCRDTCEEEACAKAGCGFCHAAHYLRQARALGTRVDSEAVKMLESKVTEAKLLPVQKQILAEAEQCAQALLEAEKRAVLGEHVRLFLHGDFMRYQDVAIARDAMECAFTLRAGTFDVKHIRKVLWSLDLSKETAAKAARNEIFHALRFEKLRVERAATAAKYMSAKDFHKALYGSLDALPLNVWPRTDRVTEHDGKEQAEALALAKGSWAILRKRRNRAPSVIPFHGSEARARAAWDKMDVREGWAALVDPDGNTVARKSGPGGVQGISPYTSADAAVAMDSFRKAWPEVDGYMKKRGAKQDIQDAMEKMVEIDTETRVIRQGAKTQMFGDQPAERGDTDDKGLRTTFDAQVSVTEPTGAIVRKAFRPEAVALPLSGERFRALVTAKHRYGLSEPYTNVRGIRQQDVESPCFIEEGEGFRLDPSPRSPYVVVFGQVKRDS